MDVALLGSAHLAAFLAATVLLAITPGPGVLYIVARTLSQGRRAGLASVAGVACGNLGNAVAASLGLAALFAVSAVAYTVVKFTGAAYLVYLGIQALRVPDAARTVPAEAARPGRIFREGMLVALLNPKTMVFFAAFLPQFVHGVVAPAWQCLLLSMVFVTIAAATDAAYVLLAGLLAPALGSPRARHHARIVAAATYLGLGIFTALASRPIPGRGA